MMLGRAAGINLRLEAQQAQVTGAMRTEAAHLHVVTQQVGVLRHLVVFAGEKLFLIIKARPPRKVAADLEILAHDVALHVRRVHTLGRVIVMRATGGVDVMIAAPPAELGGIDPALHLEGLLLLAGHLDLAKLPDALRPALEPHGVGALRQLHTFAIGAVHLRMKRKVRREAFGLRGVHAPGGITNLKRGDGRFAVFILHAQRHRKRRRGGEEHVHLIAEAEVLRALPHVKGKLRLALTLVATVKLHDAVLHLQPAQRGGQRLLVEGLQIQPAIAQCGGIKLHWFLAQPPVGFILRPATVVHRTGIRAHHAHGRRGAGLVVHLHEVLPPTGLHQRRLGRTLPNLHARFGIDVHEEQHVPVKDALQIRCAVLRLGGLGQLGLGLGIKRFAQ